MGLIPPEWQSLLGGTSLCWEQCPCLSIASAQWPLIFRIQPRRCECEITDPEHTAYVLHFSQIRWPPDVANDIYFGADQYNAGIVFPSGTRSVLFFSRHGYGNRTYKVADGCGGETGEGAAPYRRQITAFDANDLLAVKNGTKILRRFDLRLVDSARTK